MNKILITGNAIGPNNYGGINNFLKKFLTHYSSRKNELLHFSYGESPNWSFDKTNLSSFKYRLGLIIKFFSFVLKMFDTRVKIIHHNTGMSIFSILREFPFIAASLLFSKRRILFFHGWNNNEYTKIVQSQFLFSILIFMVKSSNIICVLSKDFKKELVDLGISSNKICILTTMVNTKSYSRESFPKRYHKNFNLLFCAQPLSKEKGVFEFAGCIESLLSKFPNIKIHFMGSHNKITDLKNKFSTEEYKSSIFFHGYLEGKMKNECILKSDILVFPSYTEGLPSTVLESMAAGLCIISTSVGGLQDILINRHNSIILKSPPSSKDIEEKLGEIMNDSKLFNNMRMVNYLESRRKYDSSTVSKKINQLYNRILP